MASTTMVALIAGGCSIVVGILSFVAQLVVSARTQSATMSEIEKRSELTDAGIKAQVETLSATTNIKIDELTREVREHNNFAKRVPLLELQVDIMSKQIDAMKGGK